jgi:hypothetical protein
VHSDSPSRQVSRGCRSRGDLDDVGYQQLGINCITAAENERYSAFTR